MESVHRWCTLSTASSTVYSLLFRSRAISTKSFDNNNNAKYWVCGNDEEQAKSKGWTDIEFPPCYYPLGQYKKRRLIFQTPWIMNVRGCGLNPPLSLTYVLRLSASCYGAHLP